jgi:hypothetical protein
MQDNKHSVGGSNVENSSEEEESGCDEKNNAARASDAGSDPDSTDIDDVCESHEDPSGNLGGTLSREQGRKRKQHSGVVGSNYTARRRQSACSAAPYGDGDAAASNRESHSSADGTSHGGSDGASGGDVVSGSRHGYATCNDSDGGDDGHEDACDVCQDGGELLMCDRLLCARVHVCVCVWKVCVCVQNGESARAECCVYVYHVCACCVGFMCVGIFARVFGCG